MSDVEYTLHEEPFGTGVRYVARLNGTFCFAHSRHSEAEKIVKALTDHNIYSYEAWKTAPRRLVVAFIFATSQVEPYYDRYQTNERI